MLPGDVLEQLLPKFTVFPMSSGYGLYMPDTPMDAVYFPETGMISMVANLDEGVQAEVGTVGPEGMLGVPFVSGVPTAHVEAMVQMPGTALKMGEREFRQELAAHRALRNLLHLYNEALKGQIMQTAACNGRHGLEQRLARWLLVAHDCTDGDELQLTQEFIAMMLGAHRPSVTVAAGTLQRAGSIRSAKGLITVLDRSALERAACECHGAVQRRFASIFRIDLA